MQCHRFAGHNFGVRNRGLETQPNAVLQDLIELAAFAIDQPACRQRGQLAPQRQQIGHAGRWILGIELGDHRRRSAGPISAPPGTRFQVVSTPSKISLLAGSPASSWNDSARRGPPRPPPRPKLSKPCDLCIARLRPAISANDSFNTGSVPPMSMRTAAVVGRAARTAASKAAAVHQHALRLPRGKSFNCSGNAFGSPASLNASTASTAEAV